MSNLAQRSFAGGEIAPSLHGRTDQQKYATGLRTCRNFIVQRHGGVTNRPGTQFVAETKDSGAVRLIKFVYSPDPDQIYVLEFGDGYMRVHQDGGQVVVTGVTAWVTGTDYVVGDLRSNGGINYYATRAHTSGATTEPGVGSGWASNWHALTDDIYEIPTPYGAADLSELQTVQSGDVVTITHSDYAPRNLSRTGHTTWTLETITFGPGIATPGTITLGGGSAGSATHYYAVTAVDADGHESSPSFASIASQADPITTPITLEWDPVADAVSYNVYRSSDGTTYGLITLAGGTTTTSTDTSWTTAMSTLTTTTQGTTQSAANQARNPVVSTAAERAPSGDYTITGSLDFTVSPKPADLSASLARVEAFYSRDGETRVSAGYLEIAPPQSSMPFEGTITVPDNGYTSLVIDLVAVLNAGSSVTDPTGVTFTVSVTGTDVTWSTGSTGSSDSGATPDYDYAPPSHPDVFNTAARYPSAVSYYQQRRLFASSSDEPEAVWASRTGDYANFGTSTPLQDDDAVTFSLVGRQVNEVRWLVDLRDYLYVGTTGGIVEVRGDEAGVLKPTAISPHKRSYHGVSRLAPVLITDAILYVQERGGVLRDFRPDAPVGQNDRDLTIYASHLFDGYEVVDGDYQEVPHSRLWIVRSDGTLLGLTYLREHEVWGWDRHDTDGTFENVLCVPEGNEDRVYVVVKRTINGQEKRYIERLALRTITDTTDVDDLVFMDSALTYDGAGGPAATFTGLSHLEGKAVAVYADGAVVASPNNPDYDTITVTGGQITLPSAKTVVHVGLPYLSDVETLDIDTPSGASVKPRKMLVKRLTLLLERSRSYWAGIADPGDVDPLDGLTLNELRDDANTVSPTSLRTGSWDVRVNGRWNNHGRVFIRQVDPVPLTVLAAIPEGDFPSS